MRHRGCRKQMANSMDRQWGSVKGPPRNDAVPRLMDTVTTLDLKDRTD